MSKWIKKDDLVYVLSGNDKGKTGTILARQGDRVLVKGINLRKKNLKKSQNSQMSQVVTMEMPIHISNVALCNKEGKKIKVKLNAKDDGTRDLVYLEAGKEIVHRSVRKKEKRVK